jgi:thiol-disulfide isomerase/thioredoxin
MVAQESNKEYKGVAFENGSTWAEIKAKAKAENKYVFIDAWATWCGPCIYMNKNVFPSPEVGAFFNKNFINVKLQLDSTYKDKEEVRRWYQDAKNIKEVYNIRFYPTFIFLSPEGELVHRGVGGTDAMAFIILGKEALDPQLQFYTLKKKYDAGSRDTSLLRSLATGANRAAYDELAKVVIKELLATQPTLFTKENLRLLMSTISSISDEGFEIFLKEGKKADALLGKGRSVAFVKDIIMYNVLNNELFSDEQPNKNIDWRSVEKKITEELKGTDPAIIKEIVSLIKEDQEKKKTGIVAH